MCQSRLAQAIYQAKEKQGIAFMPFVAAGYPDLETSLKVVGVLDQTGAAAIEVGFPFSDPIADGPTIQEAFTVALSRKITIDAIFDGFSRIQSSIRVPLVAMVSYSLVFRYGVETFAKKALASGFTGLLMPDLPPPEYEAVCEKIREIGLETVLLISPSTPDERRRTIASLCSGFVYYLSLAGTTGVRDQLPADLELNVTSIKKCSQVPVCVGFGVGKREHIVQLSKIADGAIVGSALVRQIKENAENPVGAVEQFAKKLITS